MDADKFMMSKKPNKIDVIQRLEEARTKLVIAAITIREACGKDVYIHADQLEGAADMIQDWIVNIRETVEK